MWKPNDFKQNKKEDLPCANLALPCIVDWTLCGSGGIPTSVLILDSI
jgi:hypothetical protein